MTQQEVVAAIILQLRTSLGLGASQVFEVVDPMAPPSIPPGGDFFVTVAVSHGTFAASEQMPGNITEEGTVTVTGYTRIKLDQVPDTNLLQDAARGLFFIKKKI